MALSNDTILFVGLGNPGEKYKNIHGSEALNENNLVCRATRTIKKKFKDKIGIMCDVALDPYTIHGLSLIHI